MRIAIEKDEILTSTQAAKLLKSSRQQISVMVKAGILPEVRVGNRFRFSKRVILEFVRTGKPQGTPQGQDKTEAGAPSTGAGSDRE